MIILGCSASNGIDISLARILGADLSKIETTTFPDGETKVKVPEIRDADGKVVIVQSTFYPQEKALFELLLASYELKDQKIKNVTAVVPYLAYARQNRSFSTGEAVSISVVLDMLRAAGVSSLITVNPHKSGPLMGFKGKVCVANVVDTLATYVKGQIKEPLVLAPDEGGLDLAKRAASKLKCDYAYIEKNRDSYGMVSIKKTHGGDFKGKDVVIFDDIISTGSTIAQAARFAYGEGASSVSAAGVHLIMASSAFENMHNAGVVKVYGTNTIPCEKADVVDISTDIAECIDDIYSNE